MPPEQQLDNIKTLLEQLPEHNYKTIQHVCRLCSLICSKSDVNKMVAPNISTVLAPNMLTSKTVDPMDLLTEMELSNAVFTLIVENYQTVFPVDDLELDDVRKRKSDKADKLRRQRSKSKLKNPIDKTLNMSRRGRSASFNASSNSPTAVKRRPLVGTLDDSGETTITILREESSEKLAITHDSSEPTLTKSEKPITELKLSVESKMSRDSSAEHLSASEKHNLIIHHNSAPNSPKEPKGMSRDNSLMSSMSSEEHKPEHKSDEPKHEEPKEQVEYGDIAQVYSTLIDPTLLLPLINATSKLVYISLQIEFTATDLESLNQTLREVAQTTKNLLPRVKELSDTYPEKKTAIAAAGLGIQTEIRNLIGAVKEFLVAVDNNVGKKKLHTSLYAFTQSIYDLFRAALQGAHKHLDACIRSSYQHVASGIATTLKNALAKVFDNTATQTSVLREIGQTTAALQLRLGTYRNARIRYDLETHIDQLPLITAQFFECLQRTTDEESMYSKATRFSNPRF